MRRRGHALVLMMVVLAALGVSLGVFMDRVTMDLSKRKADEIRTQAIWLARSALDSRQRGVMRVNTDHGEAVVHTRDDSVSVQLAGAEATIQRHPWTEHYTPPR